MKEGKIIQIVPVPFMINFVGYDFESKETYKWPVLGMALVEDEDDGEKYTYVQFISSNSNGDIDLDPPYREDCLGLEFNGKEKDWTKAIKKLIEKKEKKIKKQNVIN